MTLELKRTAKRGDGCRFRCAERLARAGRMSRTAGPTRLLLLIAALGTFAARADLPAARLNAISPPAGLRGGDVEVKVVGADLEELTALRFSDPRITAKA